MMTYPVRFSDSDIALHEALRRLDPDGVFEALMAGADMEKQDAVGLTALHVLYGVYIRTKTESEDALSAACAEALMSRGAAAWAYHRIPWESLEGLCQSREYDCRDCPGAAPAADPNGMLLDESRCTSNPLYDFIAAESLFMIKVTLFVETMSDWIARQSEDWTLRPMLLERFRKERESRAIYEACGPGRDSKAGGL